MSFPKYSERRPSGIDWLGDIPAHWSVERLKRSCRLVTDRAFERSRPVALENIESGTGRLLETDSEFQGGGTAFQPGDVLFGKLRPYLAKAWLADSPGEAVGDFHVLRPAAHMVGRFFNYELLNRAFIDLVDGSTFGSKMPRASWEFVGGMPLCVPPTDEQAAIAAFLDRETAKIDALIAEQERLIQLLTEKRQAVVSLAVTKGLNPKVPTKPSGIEWLGDVPAHWQVEPLKRSVTRLEQGWSPQCESEPAAEGAWGVLKVGCGNADSFNPTEQKALPSDVVPLPQYEVRTGDILMSRGNTLELVGLATFINNVRPLLLLSDLLYRFRPRPERADGEFLVFALRSPNLRHQIEREATGASASMKKIGQGTIRDLVVALPPLDEQLAVVSFIKSRTRALDTLSAEARHVIDLLHERRAALISAAVTGQIDVRGLVPSKAA